MKQHFCPAEQSMIAFEKECNWCGELESQEPVAWVDPTTLHHLKIGLEGVHLVYETEMVNSLPLYDKPQRTWVGLTDEERLKLYREFEDCLESDGWEYEKAIEARLKELNT
jgi:hypothetical protein